MAAQAQYVHDIRSIQDFHPELPNLVGIFNVDLRINAGDPIDPGQLANAETVATGLSGNSLSIGQLTWVNGITSIDPQVNIEDPNKIGQLGVKVLDASDVMYVLSLSHHQ
jgi:hypothetical protein